MPYDFRNQPVLVSLMCTELDCDSFFNPGLGHTGFAADGFYYAAGVKNGTQQASWATEGPSSTRSASVSFPSSALVLVSAASIAILDATDESLPLWMLFYMGDTLAYSNNPLQASTGATASGASWANGLLTIGMTPDPGSSLQAPLVLTVDFVQDSVYCDTRA